jgi:hypothetical protein
LLQKQAEAAGGEEGKRQFDAGGGVRQARSDRFADGGRHARGQTTLVSEVQFEAQHGGKIIRVGGLVLMRQAETHARFVLLAGDGRHGPSQPRQGARMQALAFARMRDICQLRAGA